MTVDVRAKTMFSYILQEAVESNSGLFGGQ